MLRHVERNLRIAAHVDDLLATGKMEDTVWLENVLRKTYQAKFQRIGSEYDKSGSYLRRTIEWADDGIHWLPDPRHADTLIKESGLEDANSVLLPMAKDLMDQKDDAELMSQQDNKIQSVGRSDKLPRSGPT